MASSSNSQSHDIFLCFRGSDTRKKFTDHLYKALKQEGFETFRDEEDIERGEDIKSELRKAIWNSKLSIIVLSKNFANSTTCLFEIQTILEHRKKLDHLILPVFYEVEPREIKDQARDLDFAEKEVPVEEVKGWSAALKEVANMAGMVSQNQSGGPLTHPVFSDNQLGHQIIRYVERVEDSVTNPPTQEFNFLPLSTLSQLSSPPPQKDIMGFVVGVSHKEKRERKWDSMDFSIRKIMLTDATMKQKLKPIKEINRNTKDWTARVNVLEKWPPGIAKDSPTKLQKLILGDAEGTRVQATIFNDDIERLQDTLHTMKSYYISNAVVKTISPQYRMVDFEWQWSISARTPILPVEEEVTEKNLAYYEFMPFHNFQQHIGTKESVHIFAAVADIQPPKTVKVPFETIAQEFIVINKEFKPTLLTLWGSFAEQGGQKLLEMANTFPIIVGLRLKVSSHNGLSLGTRGNSTLLINPNSVSAKELRQWCIENKESILNASNEIKNLIPRDVKAPAPDEFMKVAKIPTTPEMATEEFYWTRGKISIIDEEQTFWYMGCSKCLKAISANEEITFDCFLCNAKQVQAQPRAKFEVQITDDSGSIMATMFEGQANKYLVVNGKMLKAYATEKNSNVIGVFAKKELDLLYEIQLKQREYKSRGTSKLAYSISAMRDDESQSSAQNSPGEVVL
ncbi:hypothetical protein Vadar_013148 [Vaccinium darrowii]|uniref:Uncharacterized protein n=1 Tax=Vaccinium darrowii TaxID=229202 RepID=A0ACB7X0I6_9ERIC|nr:hypothetical protein Vadar_013148 [Vaccinium darrowii]